MSLKPVYVFEGRRWLPLARAATLLATNTASIKRAISEQELDWRQLKPNSSTLLVAEDDVRRLGEKRAGAKKLTARRAKSGTRTASERKRSMLHVPDRRSMRSGAVFVRTWDPAPISLPISGGTEKESNKT